MPERVRGLLAPLVAVVLLTVIIGAVISRAPVEDDLAGSLAGRLRCPVCQAESVAASPSDTARAMEAQIEEFVAEGRSEEEIIRYYTDRYGDWVLLDPPARGATLALWLAPGVLAAGGVGLVGLQVRGRRHD
ncbi:cytochrome c-type biogenesis protein [Euzebya tangerina]|uniref:cytochrome c-type biogenesis protein n=1 Tax=Euzebya tangerina TaxID=591198 RepID=UPI000E314E7E|nr:cytochrome c-type biogenesis protein [Euzebya tangerina]